MLRHMHRFQRHVLWIVLVGAVALAMTGFGMGGYDKRGNHIEAAIVNGTVITTQEVAREVFATRARYRQIFGEKADELVRQLGLSLESQATDDLIDKTLVEQHVDKLGLAIPKNEVIATIRSQLASAGFDVERFRSYLRQMGMSEEDFQLELGKDIKRGFFAAYLNHVGHASKREALEKRALKTATFDIEGVEFQPALFVKNVAEPTAAEVEKYFTEHETDYQIPAQVAFDAVAITPNLVLSEVLVDDEEIERYYTEHQGEFQSPLKGSYEVFTIPVPKDADATAISTLQEKATKAIKAIEATPGKEALVLKDAGFGKGEKHSLSAQDPTMVGKAAVALGKVGFVASPVTQEGAVAVVAVRAFTPSELKSLDAVRGDVEKKLRSREAPAYAATKANDLFAQWQGKGGSLKALLDTTKIKADVVSVPLAAVDGSSATKVPASLVKAVGQRAMSENTFLIDDAGISYLVSVTDKKESTLKALSSVEGSIKAKLKEIRAMQLLREAAEKVQSELRSNPTVDLAKLVASYGVVPEKSTYAQGKKFESGILKAPMVAEFVKSARRDNSVGAQPIYDGGKAYVVRVVKINKKATTEIKPAELAEEIEAASGDNTRVLLDAFIAHEKAHADIELKNK